MASPSTDTSTGPAATASPSTRSRTLPSVTASARVLTVLTVRPPSGDVPVVVTPSVDCSAIAAAKASSTDAASASPPSSPLQAATRSAVTTSTAPTRRIRRRMVSPEPGQRESARGRPAGERSEQLADGVSLAIPGIGGRLDVVRQPPGHVVELHDLEHRGHNRGGVDVEEVGGAAAVAGEGNLHPRLADR